MTEEKNINANAEKNKFADERLTDKELDSITGGTVARMYETTATRLEVDSKPPGTSTRLLGYVDITSTR